MVQINYIDGTTENIETAKNFRLKHFDYARDDELFIIFDRQELSDCMRIPREFVKSIRVVEV